MIIIRLADADNIFSLHFRSGKFIKILILLCRNFFLVVEYLILYC